MVKKIQNHFIFPAISVKNTVILVIDVDSLDLQTLLQNTLEELQYPSQCVSFQTTFLHFHSTYELFDLIVQKISQFSQILCVDASLSVHEIRNNLTSPWKLRELCSAIENATSDTELDELLLTTFSAVLTLESTKKLAIELFLMLNTSCDTF
ncbi:MAG: hypothetical protein ACERKZ_19180 [Lachnotalea sp.]